MRAGAGHYEADALNPSPPQVIVFGGPNGAGKSTVAPAIIDRVFGRVEFVNADAIAAGLSALDPDRQAFAAGRVMLRHLAELAAARRSFAFETTLSSRTFGPALRRMAGDGYHLHLTYVWVRSADVAVERVRARVAAGGHAVPEAVIRRRYARSARNLFDLYLPLPSAWAVLENATPDGPVLVAAGAADQPPIVYDPAMWNRLQELGHAGT